VLVYGVLGAIVMRTVMVFAGVWPIARFHWLLHVSGERFFVVREARARRLRRPGPGRAPRLTVPLR
jgi:predicted tellurium resistance membrane protein TerC